jgi:hypothetical protein
VRAAIPSITYKYASAERFAKALDGIDVISLLSRYLLIYCPEFAA